MKILDSSGSPWSLDPDADGQKPAGGWWNLSSGGNAGDGDGRWQHSMSKRQNDGITVVLKKPFQGLIDLRNAVWDHQIWWCPHLWMKKIRQCGRVEVTEKISVERSIRHRGMKTEGERKYFLLDLLQKPCFLHYQTSCFFLKHVCITLAFKS